MRYVAALFAPLACCACLPSDTRPPPAEVTVTTSSSTLTLNDIPDTSTTDGYAIHFERVLVSIGQVDLGGRDNSSCNEYSNPDYTRLFDFKQVSAPREVGIAYATGPCAFGFSLRFPNDTTLLDQGATSDDATLMRTPGTDPVSMDAGVSVYVEGTGTRGDATKHFAWPFRKRVGYDNCGPLDDAGAVQPVFSLTSGEKTSVNLEIHAEALFQNRSTSLIHFGPFAQADANGDGEIDFSELWTVPIADVIAAGFDPPPPANSMPMLPETPTMPLDPAFLCYDENGNRINIKTLGDYAYCELLPALARYQGNGVCSVMTGRANHD
jgi:hypothetical protein